ncbi:helix-turn-helix domain-containing protein [Streptomyces sp. NPDC059802]|uniref:MmyB family transcriptional regulator n=1 Tax=Streptomyces sp. NPDC059802 TaxID=3346952 RepID=UPI003661934C
MHKKSLKQFLYERRARIEPESVGLARPTGSGRRAVGLAQQQVDALLGLPIHTCNRLENGKNPNPAPELLRAVAELYRLDEHEWIMLYRYAREQEPPAPLYPDSGYRVPSAWQAAVDGIQHMAYVSDAAWNVLACNSRWASMFPSGQIPENTLRWMCLSAEARTVLTNWESAWAPRVLPQLRAALAARRDPTLQRLEDDVIADPVAGPLYEARGVTIHPDGDERPLNHAVHGPGWVTMCSATPESSPGARLMILLFSKNQQRPGPRTPLRASTGPASGSGRPNPTRHTKTGQGQ